MTSAEPINRPRTEAVPFDHALRYWVPSARNRGERYLVQLDAFGTNGTCTCRHFSCRCEPLLRRGLTPAQAVEAGLIRLKENRHVEDALRCEHLITARSQFCDDVVAAIAEREKRRYGSGNGRSDGVE